MDQGIDIDEDSDPSFSEGSEDDDDDEDSGDDFDDDAKNNNEKTAKDSNRSSAPSLFDKVATPSAKPRGQALKESAERSGKLRVEAMKVGFFCPRRNLQFRGGLQFDMASVVYVCVSVPGQTLLIDKF